LQARGRLRDGRAIARTKAPDPHNDWHSADSVDGRVSSDVTTTASVDSCCGRLLDDLPVDPNAVPECSTSAAATASSPAKRSTRSPATVVLHGFSEPMLMRAGDYLAADLDRVRFHVADLRDRDWTEVWALWSKSRSHWPATIRGLGSNKANHARSDAIRRSQLSTSSKPPPQRPAR
jgi:hypothetical protein